MFSKVRVISEVQALLNESEDGFVKSLNAGLENYFRKLGAALSHTHSWAFTPTERLQVLLREKAHAEDVAGLNKAYWQDLSQSIDASRHFFLKRSYPLVESSVFLLNSGNLLSAGSVVRSLFELAIWSLQHSGTFKNTVKDELPRADAAKHIMGANGLQDLVMKLIWGTRLKERTTRNEELSQMHIIDQFKKIAKREDRNYIEPMYDFLCELCHPNAVGNWLFADSNDVVNEKSKIEILISASQNGAEAEQTIAHLCGCLCWSVTALVHANEQYDKALELIEKKFDLRSLIH